MSKKSAIASIPPRYPKKRLSEVTEYPFEFAMDIKCGGNELDIRKSAREYASGRLPSDEGNTIPEPSLTSM
jgi:hypothetical protein